MPLEPCPKLWAVKEAEKVGGEYETTVNVIVVIG